MYSAKLMNKQMDTVYGLYLPEYTIPAPEVQTNYVDIPGKDGAVDKTAPDGVVRYKNREWTLSFQKTGATVSADDLQSISSTLHNDLHGRKGEVIFDDDSNYKWIGRTFIQDVLCENNGLIIVNIQFISEPYKRKITDISRSVTLSSTSQTIALTNGRKPLIPTIIVAGENSSAVLVFTIKGEEYTVELSAGTWTVTDLVLFEGTTNVAATGSGTLTITYPEYSL